MSTVIPALSVGSLIEAFNTLFTRRIPRRRDARLRDAEPRTALYIKVERRGAGRVSQRSQGLPRPSRAAVQNGEAADKSAVRQFTIAVIQVCVLACVAASPNQHGSWWNARAAVDVILSTCILHPWW